MLGDKLDSHVGEILKTLDELSLTESTLVIFTSDNGSTPRDFKGTQDVRLNLADDSGDIRVKFKTAKEDAMKLGHVNNGPWRDGKGYSYEGGHRVPFIARLPGRIAARSTSDCTITMTDLFATAADVVAQDLPPEAAEDSFSLLPVLLGKEKRIAGHESFLILENGKDSAVAVCTGKWKLIIRYGSDRQKGNEICDLSKDPGELENLSAQYPEVAQRLARAFQQAEAAGKTRP